MSRSYSAVAHSVQVSTLNPASRRRTTLSAVGSSRWGISIEEASPVPSARFDPDRVKPQLSTGAIR